MSLDSLEKRTILKPVQAELDRQKEKNAAMKKALVSVRAGATELINILRFTPGVVLPREAAEGMDALSEVVNHTHPRDINKEDSK